MSSPDASALWALTSKSFGHFFIYQRMRYGHILDDSIRLYKRQGCGYNSTNGEKRPQAPGRLPRRRRGVQLYTGRKRLGVLSSAMSHAMRAGRKTWECACSRARREALAADGSRSTPCTATPGLGRHTGNCRQPSDWRDKPAGRRAPAVAAILAATAVLSRSSGIWWRLPDILLDVTADDESGFTASLRLFRSCACRHIHSPSRASNSNRAHRLAAELRPAFARPIQKPN